MATQWYRLTTVLEGCPLLNCQAMRNKASILDPSSSKYCDALVFYETEIEPGKLVADPGWSGIDDECYPIACVVAAPLSARIHARDHCEILGPADGGKVKIRCVVGLPPGQKVNSFQP